MFAIDSLFQVEELSPLKKLYENDPSDRRLVVVVAGDNTANIKETVSLHQWLESQGYRSTPDTWETENLDVLSVVHISQLALTVMRADPFAPKPAALPPNSWLNKLDQRVFDALLLAQEMGEVPRQPTRMFIIQSLKPTLTAENPEEFWASVLGDVAFAQSGEPAKNPRQKMVLDAWERVMRRRHYDPTSDDPEEDAGANSKLQITEGVVTERVYDWQGADIAIGWNETLTQFYKWIAQRLENPDDIRRIAAIAFGSSAGVSITGNMTNNVYSLVDYAKRYGKLSRLATVVNYEQSARAGVSLRNADVQGDLEISGVKIINTGRAPYVRGSVVVGGDFVGGDKVGR